LELKMSDEGADAMKPQSQSARAIVRRARKTIVAENAGLRADLERERQINAVIIDRLVQRLEEVTAELSALRDKRPAVTVVWPAPIRREIPQPVKGVR
jgi:hypothetical protein